MYDLVPNTTFKLLSYFTFIVAFFFFLNLSSIGTVCCLWNFRLRFTRVCCHGKISPCVAKVSQVFYLLMWHHLPYWIFKDLFSMAHVDLEGHCSSVYWIKNRQTVFEILQLFDCIRWQPSAILDYKKLKFCWLMESRGQSCIIMPNFVKIGEPVAEIWHLFYF